MSVPETVSAETDLRMKLAIESLKKEFTRIRTGRASPSLLDGLKVEYYGSPMPINQVATITIPEARLIIIQPWEKTMLGPIEKAILASDLNLTPKNDGNMIKLPLPPLSEERRKDLFKKCKGLGEDCKVSIRNVRRDSNEELKVAEKEKKMTEDDLKKAMEDIQKLTDKNIKSVDELLVVKEKEIMEF